jgi:hypothetical protein
LLLPYENKRTFTSLLAYPDLTNDYRNALENSKEKKEIREMYEGDIAD